MGIVMGNIDTVRIDKVDRGRSTLMETLQYDTYCIVERNVSDRYLEEPNGAHWPPARVRLSDPCAMESAPQLE